MRLRTGPWPLVLITCCLIAGNTAAEEQNWLGAETNWLASASASDQLYSLGELGEVSVAFVRLSFADQRSSRRLFPTRDGARPLGLHGYESCPNEVHLAVTPGLRIPPGSGLSGLDNCEPEGSSSLGGLIPRISIQGTFFSVGYGIELDKKNRGLFVEYGAFTVGIGDSPNGGSIFSGASFGLPRWVPGRELIPRHIRDDIEFNVGLSLQIDSIDIDKWEPHFGVGVELLEW